MFSEDFNVVPFSIENVIDSLPQLYEYDTLIISNEEIGADFPLEHFTVLRFYGCTFTDIRKSVNSMSCAEEIIIIKCSFNNVDSFKSLFASKGLCRVTFDSCDLSNIKNMSRMFESNTHIQRIQFTNNDTRNLLSISRMFANCFSLKSIEGLGTLDVSNVEDMSHAFFSSDVTDIYDLKFWDVSKVKYMMNTFSICYSLNDISPLRLWNVSKVENMYELFARSSQLTSLLPLSLWNVSKVKDMHGIFSYCTSLSSLRGLEYWDTSNVCNMKEAFESCSKVKSLQPLQDWNVSNVKNMYGMFKVCKELRDLHGLERWNISNVEDISIMFGWCVNLTSIWGLKDWNVSSVKCMDNLIEHCDNLESLSTYRIDKGTISHVKGSKFASYHKYNFPELEHWRVSHDIYPLVGRDKLKTIVLTYSGIYYFSSNDERMYKEIYYGHMYRDREFYERTKQGLKE